MNSVIELLEYNLKSILDARLIQSFESGSIIDDEDLPEVYESLNEYTYSPFIPERKEFEMRALTGYSHSKKDMIFYDVDDNAIDLDYFKRLLLYYDRVVVTIHTEFFYEKMWSRTALVDLMNFLLSIKPLVEKNIINFINESRLYNVDELFQEDYKLLTGESLPDYLEIGSTNKSKKRQQLSPRIIADLNVCHIFDLDYVTTLRRNWDQMKKAMLRPSKKDLEKEAQHFWATSLVSFDLPNLHKLTFHDIVSIRNNSQAFEEWRKMLDELFELISKNQPNSLEAIGREVQYFSKHRVLENKRKLNEEIKNSSLKTHLKNSALIITVSFLGQLLASNIFDISLTKQLVTLIAGSSGVAGLATYPKKRRIKNKNILLSKYCSLLEEVSSVDPNYFEISK